jgi:site-specific DNA recombinase
VSSERQKEEHTIGSQILALMEYARNEAYTVPQEWIFQDEGYSGATLVRPGLERLRDLSSEGQIGTVLAYCPDRLSRKYAYQVLLIEEFARDGVAVEFVKSPKATTPEEELLLQFQGMIAEYERAQIAERSRRGKRYRAKAGSVSVLSGAPYGYRYIKKTDTSAAYYEVIAEQAEVVRKVFKLFTEDGLSINAIARWLNAHAIATRKGKSKWERSTVWAMLRNPAYKGTACFGKTERAERQKVTRPLRQRGGFSPRCNSNRGRPRAEWIEIAVPVIVREEVFALAHERLEQNKRFSPRRTIEPTLLQGMLVCSKCGYAFYRTSTRTSKKKIYYYRCLGSDNYRHPNGRVCHNRPIRQDYLDEVVWKHVVQLLENPELIRAEIQRRLKQIQDSSPTKRRKEAVEKEVARIDKSIEKLLDAYQEGLLRLEELRKRMPGLRKRQDARKSELNSLEVAAASHQGFLRLAESMEDFLARLRKTAHSMSVSDRQKILRLVVKEILIDFETIKIRHSIPVTRPNPPPGPPKRSEMPSYLLRSWSHDSSLGRPFGTCFASADVAPRTVFTLPLHRCFEPHFEKMQNGPVRNPLRHYGQELCVRNGVEVLGYIGIDDLCIPAVEGIGNVIDRIVGRLLRPVPVGAVTKIRLEDRLNDQLHGHLRHPVADGRDPQCTLAAVCLGDHHPSDRLGCVALALQCLLQLRYESGLPFCALYGRKGNTVNTGAAFVGPHQAIGVTEDVSPIHLVIECVEAKGRLLLGLTV